MSRQVLGRKKLKKRRASPIDAILPRPERWGLSRILIKLNKLLGPVEIGGITLQGKRVGDKFYCENGDVLQADHNAALNVKARLGDNEISRFTSFKEVRRILLSRSIGATERQGLELGAQARQPSADKS